ncbi:hypothetical protein OPAG_09264 [Rhodococcus opacus PD630]|nr:hypothetical protein OPAG_09264 [Rhodococcus opacus PD630]
MCSRNAYIAWVFVTCRELGDPRSPVRFQYAAFMPDMQQFADVVNLRRRQLGLSLAAVATQGGPSEPTMVRIESGESPPLRVATFKKLDHALRWAEGSAATAYEGGEPTPLGSDEVGAPAGEVSITYSALGELVEVSAELRRLANDIDEPELSAAVDRLRTLISPHIGRVASAMLRDRGEQGHISPTWVAQALEEFWSVPPDDITPARTKANIRRRSLAHDLTKDNDADV